MIVLHACFVTTCVFPYGLCLVVRGYLKTAGETHDMTTSRARESAVIIINEVLKINSVRYCTGITANFIINVPQLIPTSNSTNSTMLHQHLNVFVILP